MKKIIFNAKKIWDKYKIYEETKLLLQLLRRTFVVCITIPIVIILVQLIAKILGIFAVYIILAIFIAEMYSCPISNGRP